MDEKNMSIVEHLSELRKVLIVSAIAILIGGLICFFAWGDLLFDIVTAPLNDLDVSLVYISMPEAFITKIKIALVAGVILVSPIVFWQFWSYIVPALHQNEKKIILTLLPASIILFASGILFAYFTVFRFAASFLLLVAGEGLEAMISISRYVSFFLGFLLPFGIIFQMPLVVLFLTRIGLVTSAKLVSYRKYVIVLSFVVGAVLTPTPDIVSQLFMAGSLLVLYEVSVLVSKLFKPKAIDYDDDSVETPDTE